MNRSHAWQIGRWQGRCRPILGTTSRRRPRQRLPGNRRKKMKVKTRVKAGGGLIAWLDDS
jgi:hypothetical protein